MWERSGGKRGVQRREESGFEERRRGRGSPRERGEFSHVRDAGSKPMTSIVLPNVPPVSDTSNPARSTIQRVIFVNESLSAATRVPRVEFICSSAFLKRNSIFLPRVPGRPLRFQHRTFIFGNAETFRNPPSKRTPPV